MSPPSLAMAISSGAPMAANGVPARCVKLLRRSPYYIIFPAIWDASVCHAMRLDALLARGPSPGRIVVQRSGATQIEPHKNGRERLDRLWAAFRQRHPNHLARFARRYPTIKHISAKIVVTQAAVSTKSGRNDSRPRGSGRKYKKCCGAI